MTEQKIKYELIDEKEYSPDGKQYSQKPMQLINLENQIKQKNLNRYFKKIRKQNMYSQFSKQFTIKSPKYHLQYLQTLNNMYNKREKQPISSTMNTRTFNTQRTNNNNNAPLDTSFTGRSENQFITQDPSITMIQYHQQQQYQQMNSSTDSKYNQLREIRGALQLSNSGIYQNKEEDLPFQLAPEKGGLRIENMSFGGESFQPVSILKQPNNLNNLVTSRKSSYEPGNNGMGQYQRDFSNTNNRTNLTFTNYNSTNNYNYNNFNTNNNNNSNNNPFSNNKDSDSNFFKSNSENKKAQINFVETSNSYVNVNNFINKESQSTSYNCNFVSKRRNLINYFSIDRPEEVDSPQQKLKKKIMNVINKLQVQDEKQQNETAVPPLSTQETNANQQTGISENILNKSVDFKKTNYPNITNKPAPLNDSLFKSRAESTSPIGHVKTTDLLNSNNNNTNNTIRTNNNINNINNDNNDINDNNNNHHHKLRKLQLNSARGSFVPQLDLKECTPLNSQNFAKTVRNESPKNSPLRIDSPGRSSPLLKKDSSLMPGGSGELGSMEKLQMSIERQNLRSPRQEDRKKLDPQDPRLQGHFQKLCPQIIKGMTHRNIRISRENIKDFMAKRYGPMVGEKFVVFLDVLMQLDFKSFITLMDTLLNLSPKEKVLFCFLMFDASEDGYIDNSDLFFIFKASRFNQMIEMDILEIIEFCQTELNNLQQYETEENFIESLMVKRNYVILTQYRVMVKRGKELTIPTDLKKDTLYHLSFNVIEHSSNSRLTMKQIQDNQRKVAEKEKKQPQITEYVSETKFCLNFDHFMVIFRDKTPYIYYDIVRYLCLFQFQNLRYLKTNDFLFQSSHKNRTISEIDQQFNDLLEKEKWEELIKMALRGQKDIPKEIEQFRNEIEKMRDFLNYAEGKEGDQQSPDQKPKDQSQETPQQIFQMKDFNFKSQF